MYKAWTDSRLLRLVRGERRSAVPDAADYGTAFGLELSLMDDKDLSPPPAQPRQRRGWLQRWSLLRHKAA